MRRELENAEKTENGEAIFEPKRRKSTNEEVKNNGVETAEEGTTSKAAEASDETANERTAVVLAFSLPPAAYATMLLREFLRNESEEDSCRVDSSTGKNAYEDDAEDDKNQENTGEEWKDWILRGW